MKPILNITHNDMDGAGSAIMVQIALGLSNVATESVGYNELDDATKAAFWHLMAGEAERVIFTDIAPKRWALEWLDKHPDLAARVQVFDHHANSDWAKWWQDTASKNTAIEGVYNAGACGTVLAGAHLLGANANDGDRQFWGLVDVYDRWQIHHENRRDSERLNAYFRFVGFRRFVDTMRVRLCDSFDWVDGLPLTAEEQAFLAISEERDQEYVKARVSKAVIETDTEGRHFAWVVADRLVSAVGDELSKLADYAAVVSPEWGTISLRSLPARANVGEIARARGGGGHDHASGYHYSADWSWLADGLPEEPVSETERTEP